MSLDFTETLTIEVPDVEEQVAAFGENEYKKSHGLVIEVAAIHEGMTANFNYYPAEALENALESWVRPYPKPIIMNHDPSSEPVGRVIAAKMEKEADGTPYTLLQVAITDPEAIAKVMDQRYLTGSVGGSAKQANCSVCGVDWAEASIRNIPCKHSRGKTYKGKLCYMEMNGIGFKEYSFVNMPADQLSSIRSLQTSNEAEESDGWVKAARVFSLNMDDEEILEFSESATDDSNILSAMKKKDATPIYMQLKGSFLSAMAVAESEKDDRNNEEPDVSKEIITEEEEDILAVAEGLSSDLADTPAEDVEENEDVHEEDESVAETEETVEESEEEEISEETNEEVVAEEEEVEEAEKPEAQESPRDKDVDPENSDGAPVSREDNETEEVVEEGEEEEIVNEEDGSETDLSEEIVTLESRVEELEAREQTLLEENAKLKDAMKRQLAERVVDTKVALGLIEAEDRAGELEEHAKRSASSLADSMRDLAGMAKVQKTDISAPQVNNESAAVTESNSVIVDDEGEELEENEDKDPEDVFVDALMGRRKL